MPEATLLPHYGRLTMAATIASTPPHFPAHATGAKFGRSGGKQTPFITALTQEINETSPGQTIVLKSLRDTMMMRFSARGDDDGFCRACWSHGSPDWSAVVCWVANSPSLSTFHSSSTVHHLLSTVHHSTSTDYTVYRPPSQSTLDHSPFNVYRLPSTNQGPPFTPAVFALCDHPVSSKRSIAIGYLPRHSEWPDFEAAWPGRYNWRPDPGAYRSGGGGGRSGPIRGAVGPPAGSGVSSGTIRRQRRTSAVTRLCPRPWTRVTGPLSRG